MANQLTMADIQAILTLHAEGVAESTHCPGVEHRPRDGRKVHPGSGLRSKTSQSAHRLGDDGRAGDRRARKALAGLSFQ